MTRALYTFVMDYRGGTYVSQVAERSLKAAVLRWVSKLDTKRIGAARKALRPASFSWEDGQPVPVEGTAGVWCFDLRLGRFLAIVHVVRTYVAGSPAATGEAG